MESDKVEVITRNTITMAQGCQINLYFDPESRLGNYQEKIIFSKKNLNKKRHSANIVQNNNKRCARNDRRC